MSSMETPPDSPDPTEDEALEGTKSWLFWNGCLIAIALTVIGFGRASGAFDFFR